MVRCRWVGNCLDLWGLPRLGNDRLINIVSVLWLVYTHLPGEESENTAAGDSKQEQEARGGRLGKEEETRWKDVET